MPDTSEIARLRAAMQAEYDAAHNGLYGLASGTARHRFITARTENIARYRQQLEAVAGPEETRKIMLSL